MMITLCDKCGAETVFNESYRATVVKANKITGNGDDYFDLCGTCGVALQQALAVKRDERKRRK